MSCVLMRAALPAAALIVSAVLTAATPRWASAQAATPITVAGSALSVTDIAARGTDSLASRLLPGDTAVVIQAPTQVCGAKKVCPRGWDVMVSAVSLPDVPAMPVRAPIYARVRFTNRGSIASPAAEARVCLQSSYYEECEGASASTIVEVPELPSLGEAIVTAVLRPGEATRAAHVIAEFDPDGLTDETKDPALGAAKKSNNRKASNVFAIESPNEIEWLNLSHEVSGRVVTLILEIRNPSVIQPSLPATYTVEANSECGGMGGRSLGLIEIGPIAPRNRVTARVHVQFPVGSRIGGTSGDCRTDITYLRISYELERPAPMPPNSLINFTR